MLSLFDSSRIRKTIHKQKFNECKQYTKTKRLIAGYFNKICAKHSVSEKLIANIFDLIPRKIEFDILPKQIKCKDTVTSDTVLNMINSTATIGSSTGFNEGIHEWTICLSSRYSTDDYHYYFGVVTHVDDYVHSEYSEWNGIGYISSTFGHESSSDLHVIDNMVRKSPPKHEEYHVRIRLDCEEWTYQVWVNDEMDGSVSCIMDGVHMVENEENCTVYPLVKDETYFPVVSVYKKERCYGIR